MILIPKTHGRAGVRTINAREYYDYMGEMKIKDHMIHQLNEHFQEAFGVDAPEAWLSWEVIELPGEVDIRLEANAPLKANSVWIAPHNEVRRFVIPVTDTSRIPVVSGAMNYLDQADYHRSSYFLTFQGWNAETGLMVFDREEQ